MSSELMGERYCSSQCQIKGLESGVEIFGKAWSLTDLIRRIHLTNKTLGSLSVKGRSGTSKLEVRAKSHISWLKARRESRTELWGPQAITHLRIYNLTDKMVITNSARKNFTNHWRLTQWLSSLLKIKISSNSTTRVHLSANRTSLWTCLSCTLQKKNTKAIVRTTRWFQLLTVYLKMD